jgi:hypothetical protein
MRRDVTYKVDFISRSLLSVNKHVISPPHTRATCWANRLAWQLAQLCIFIAHVGKTTQQQHKWQNHLHFPPFCSKSHDETMVCHWLIDSNSSALSSQHPQTLRFFPREAKNIKHDRYFPQSLERSNPHENYPHTRATCWANRLAIAVFSLLSVSFNQTTFYSTWSSQFIYWF